MTEDPDNLIQVTPSQRIKIPNEIRALIDRPTDSDFVIRNLASKLANGQPLIQGELVVAGHHTLNDFPLAARFPVHFRKTYYPTCFHQSPQKEFDYHTLAAQHLTIAPPIGWTKNTFRSCFIPGTSYQKLSPFGVEPIEQNLTLGGSVSTPTLIGLWNLLERLYTQVKTLHAKGLVHGDLFLHNVIVSTCPIAINLIDFELAKTRAELKDEAAWKAKKEEDCAEIWKHAIFLQSALGRQAGPLAEDSLSQIQSFFKDPAAVHRQLELATPR